MALMGPVKGRAGAPAGDDNRGPPSARLVPATTMGPPKRAHCVRLRPVWCECYQTQVALEEHVRATGGTFWRFLVYVNVVPLLLRVVNT